MAATINGTTFSDTVDNTSGARYLEGQPSIDVPIYELENIASPGANGTRQKNFGFRARNVSALLAFIGADCPAVMASVASFSSGLAPNRFSGTFSGVSMPGLQCVQCSPSAPFVISNGGTAAAKCLVQFAAIQREA